MNINQQIENNNPTILSPLAIRQAQIELAKRKEQEEAAMATAILVRLEQRINLYVDSIRDCRKEEKRILARLEKVNDIKAEFERTGDVGTLNVALNKVL